MTAITMDELLKEKIKRIKNRRNNPIRSRVVQAKTRSIRTTWTREMAFEINSHHGIDLNQELEQTLLEEFQNNITEK
jgi:hypothetical protein